MMIRTSAIASVAAISAAMAACPALAQNPEPIFTHDGWGSAEFGMSFDELRGVFPDATVSGLCVVEGNIQPGCRDLRVTTNTGPGWHISLSFSTKDRLSEILFYRNDNPSAEDYATAVAQQSRILRVEKEESFNNDSCSDVLAKWNAGNSVRTFEFFAHDAGKRTFLSGGHRSAVVTLKEDSRCAGGPQDLYQRPPTRVLKIQYKDTSLGSE